MSADYQSNMTPPTGYTKKNTEDLFFQKMADAGAAGDLGGQMKPYDRAGLSRGSAQKSQAGVAIKIAAQTLQGRSSSIEC